MNDIAANGVALRPPWRRAANLGLAVRVSGEPAGWVALTGAFLFSMLWGIRSFGLQDNNEGIYAEVAREMNARGDWIVPHLNGAPYLEKPPLLYWLEAALLRAFGDHEWVVRLGPVLCFAGTLAALIWIGREIRRVRSGRNAAVLLCSAGGVVVMSRSLLFDAPLTCLLTWTLALFLQWRVRGTRWALRGCYALLALGVLAKGLIALVLGGGTMALSSFLARRSWRDVLRVFDPKGATIFAALVLPWHLVASLRQPGFAEFYFINEHVRRFLGSREPHDFYTGPIYYYLLRLPMYLGVWSFALPMFWPNRAQPPELSSPAEAEARRILGVCVAIAFAFFSISEGKANYYLLSVMPAFALLLALQWPGDGPPAKRLFFSAVGIAFLGLVIASAPRILASKPDVAALLLSERWVLIGLALALVVLGTVIALLVSRGWNDATFWCVALAGLLLLLPAPAFLHGADEMLSQRAVAQYLLAHRDSPVVLYRDYEKLSSVVFYLRHPVPVLESESNELYYAHQRYADIPSFLELDQFQAMAHRRGAWVITTPGHVDEALRQFGSDSARVVRRFPKAIVLSVGPAVAAAPPAADALVEMEVADHAAPTVLSPPRRRLVQ